MRQRPLEQETESVPPVMLYLLEKFRWLGTAMLPAILAPVSQVLAAPAYVALVSKGPETASLSACICRRASASGRVLSAEQMVEGLEFRISLRRVPGEAPLLLITALLKPDTALLGHSHDNDPEAQAESQARLIQMLRIHVGTRAWVWKPGRETTICDQAFAWILGLRSHPIVLDHIDSDGEPR